uniref:Uncharacterized protein n=1 Tax=Plectus sambesii TaxID=2011161 RepID=A0A914WD90_9BILA
MPPTMVDRTYSSELESFILAPNYSSVTSMASGRGSPSTERPTDGRVSYSGLFDGASTRWIQPSGDSSGGQRADQIKAEWID